MLVELAYIGCPVPKFERDEPLRVVPYRGGVLVQMIENGVKHDFQSLAVGSRHQFFKFVQGAKPWFRLPDVHRPVPVVAGEFSMGGEGVPVSAAGALYHRRDPDPVHPETIEVAIPDGSGYPGKIAALIIGPVKQLEIYHRSVIVPIVVDESVCHGEIQHVGGRGERLR